MEIQDYTDVETYRVENPVIAPARLTTSGSGAAKPMGDKSTELGRALNQRIELVKK